MNMFSIKFWFFYITIIVIFQMFFFTIYNIPIYKIYCELNNYYSNDFLINDKYNMKYVLYNSLNEYGYLYNINNFNINSLLKIDNSNNLILNYITLLSSMFYNLNNFYFYNIYYIFNIYDLSSSFFINNFFINNNIANNESDFTNFFYVIYFNTSITSINLVEFISLQNNIYVVPGETYLVFFRLYNPTDFFIKGISIYFISPSEINAYLFKIQCFCFDELMLYPFESIDLPILFYISSDVVITNIEFFFFFQIQIIYLFILNTF